MDLTLLSLCCGELAPFCDKWQNGLVASQYQLPYQLTLKHLPTSASILDWGCGDGHFSFFLLSQGADVTAYSFDVIGAMEAELDKRFKKRFNFERGTDPIALPFGDGTFDGVCSIGVLEHVWETGGDELASLKEIHRILKPGGKVFVFHFPNRTSWIELANRLCVKMGLFQKYTHGRLYTKQQIEQLAKDSGFTLLEHGVYNLLPRNLFRKWPKPLANNALLIRIFHLLEQALSLFLEKFSQNHFFILQKPNFESICV